jgi:hypothetical protein
MASRGGGGRGWRAHGGSPGGSRGGRGGTNRGGGGHRVCRNFQLTGHCRNGAGFTFSHDRAATKKEEQSKSRRENPESTFEQQMAKDDYNAWKRIIKAPPIPNNIYTLENLWAGARTILNGEGRKER